MFPDQQQPNPPSPSQQPQRAADGQYQVLPPLVTSGSGPKGHNPYEFIFADTKPKRGFGLGGGGGRKTTELAIFGALLLVVLVVLYVAFSAFKPKSITPELLAVAQRQQEIIRIATNVTQQVSAQSVGNFVINTEFTVTTSQTQVLAYLGKHGSHPKPKTLALDQSTQTDGLLASALSANTYDTTVTQTLVSELNTYTALLQSTYKHATATTTKQLLQANFTAAEALLKQAQGVQTDS